MHQEDTLRVTLLISLFLHGAIILFLPFFKYIPQKKELTSLEVTYRSSVNKISKEKRGGISKEMPPISQKNLPKLAVGEDTKEIKQTFKLDLSELFKPKETVVIPKPQLLSQIQKTQKINLKNLPTEMSKDPAYLDYRDLIRRKIQDKVYYYSEQYFYFDNPHEGKIFVSFVVNSGGQLKDIYILNEKSSEDESLRKIVLTAIKNSSPFNKFPKDLRYDERTFNLEISFEIE